VSVEGLEGFSGTDMVIPELVMIQNTTGEISGLIDEKTGAAVEQLPGLFVDKKARVSYGKKLEVVLLQASKRRKLWYDKKKDQKTGVKCYSLDGISPADNAAEKQADTCAECQHSQRDIEFHMLFLDVERSLEASAPVLFRFVSKSTANTPVRNMVSAIVKRKQATREFQVTMATMKDSNNKGNFVNLTFGSLLPVKENPKLEAIVEEAYLTYVESASPANDDSQSPQEEEPAAVGGRF
jgi:hypothetical protein